MILYRIDNFARPTGFFRVAGILFIVLIFGSPLAVAQLGPGGVSHDTPNSINPTQSDNRLWLSAGSLTDHADGDLVTEWNDISPSAVNDRGFRNANDNFLPPVFRDAPGAAINGHPVLTFEGGRMLRVNSSSDLNTSNQTTYEQTIVFAFRTSEDVNSRQVIWEEGGTVRGMNVYIYNGELYLGAYDAQNDNDPGSPNVPKFGYNYVKTPVQPNTTYILSHVFWAPTNNSLNGWVRGYRNGSYFGTLINGGHHNGGIGGVFRHPNPIGIGAVNDDTYNETGPINNAIGTLPFKGRLAEICYYSRLLNDAERIIVENYLGAKYFANIIVNDRYAHQSNYGYEVIGIGQTNSSANRHTVSKGTNLFEISPVNENLAFNQPNEYLLVGHNGGVLSFTEDNTPNDPGSTRRTHRIWRWDETGDLGRIRLRFYPGDLPPIPAGFSKYVLLFDEDSENYPNFTGDNTKVIELEEASGGFLQAQVDIADGAFMALGAIKPQVSFRDVESFIIEGNPSPDKTPKFNTVFARLNFVPSSMVVADISFTDGTATRATDYDYYDNDVSNGIYFPPGLQEVPIRIFVRNDVLPEDPSTETFHIHLHQGDNITPGLGIGERSQHTVTIYDDDPPPKIGFAQSSSSALENVGSHLVDIVRTGTTAGAAQVRVKVIDGQSTAEENLDYTFPAYKTVTFAPGESVKTVSIDVVSDDLDEFDETIRLQLFAIQGAGATPNAIHHEITIVDDDLPPVVQFTSASSQNLETNGSPLIYIELDRPSSKEVSVTYETVNTLPTAANNPQDYTVSSPFTVVIPAGDTLTTPVGFTVQQDGVDEDDETVEFVLTAAVNASIGAPSKHVYTIKDYSVFEWLGAGGVGQNTDNIFWIEANRQSGSHNSTLQTLTDFSPHNINITQSNSSQRARLQTSSNLMNGKKTLLFDGNNDVYRFERHGLINMAPYTTKKAYFMAIHTGSSTNGWHTLYKQGGGSRGFNIYIYNGSLYFHVWNNRNDGPESPWGSGSGTVRYARFDGIAPNTSYVVSCLFDKDDTEKIRVYVNGTKGQRTETQPCGRVYSHSGSPSMGGADGSIRYHNNQTASGRYYNGAFAEMIHFTEAPINDTRRRIIENYLARKYGIPLNVGRIGTGDFALSHGVAGIGNINAGANEVHSDAQGNSILRAKTPSIMATNSFALWGHNNRPLNESWPWSNAPLPSGILERSGRVWRMDKTGNINGFEILVRYDELENAASFSTNDLKLLVHSNADEQDFSNAVVYDASTILSGHVVRFQNVNVPNGGYFALANASVYTPLPIELVSFDADPEEHRVNLHWTTASEVNNDHFVVERAGPDLNFRPLLQRPGAGNSNSVLHYREEDNSPLVGVSYYRLKQVDYNGDFKYSDPVAVYFDDGETERETSFLLYPNPNSGQTVHIEALQPTDGETFAVTLYDMTGKSLLSSELDRTTNRTSLTLPSHLTAGVYIMKFSSRSTSQSHKLIIR